MRSARPTRPHGRSDVGAPTTVDPVAVLRRLRGQGEGRAEVDPGLAPGLQDWLEDELAPAANALPTDAPPVRVTKAALTRVLACDAQPAVEPPPSRELVRGTLVDVLFRQWVVAGRIGDAMEDALSALAVAGDHDGAVAYVAALSVSDRRALADEVVAHGARIKATWPALAAAWRPRTQERLATPLCGGRIVLAGVLDLAVGPPSSGRASVCVVEAKSGRRRLEHRADLHFYALLETLRSGAPPFRIATYYSATGELDVEPVGDDTLVGAVWRTITGARRLCALAAGAAPTPTPNPRCRTCPALTRCEAGLAATTRPTLEQRNVA